MSNTFHQRIEYYYYKNPELMRLKRDNIHILEFDSTCHIMDFYIRRPSRILDCCAGTGDYAFYLAKSNHSVVAGDLLRTHTDIIRANSLSKMLESVYCGNILDLKQFPDNSFDVIICFGAFYHLTNRCDRDSALYEIVRMLKNGGIVIITYLIRNRAYKEKIEAKNGLCALPLDTIFHGFLPEEFTHMIESTHALKTELHITNAEQHNAQRINSLNKKEFKRFCLLNKQRPFDQMCIGHAFRALWVGKKELDFSTAKQVEAICFAHKN